MSNRNFSKKFAIALGATLGAAGVLNSVSVSARVEKYDIYETKSALRPSKGCCGKK